MGVASFIMYFIIMKTWSMKIISLLKKITFSFHYLPGAGLHWAETVLMKKRLYFLVNDIKCQSMLSLWMSMNARMNEEKVQHEFSIKNLKRKDAKSPHFPLEFIPSSFSNVPFKSFWWVMHRRTMLCKRFEWLLVFGQILLSSQLYLY